MEFGLVNIFVNSGIKAAPRVPQLIITESTSQNFCNGPGASEFGPSGNSLRQKLLQWRGWK